MPEGPEIRRAAARLARVLEGKVAEEVHFGQKHLQPMAALLTGSRIEEVTSKGKALLTRFDNDLSVYSHNQLYGKWYVVRRGKSPRTDRTLRLEIRTDTHRALLYSASEIEILDDRGVRTHPYLARLGPDALDAEVTWQDIASRLRSPGFRRRSLAALYLDQRFVAGIGNSLRSEILFDARLHPGLRPDDLTRGETGRLARSTIDITRRAFRTAGVTNPPARVRALRKQGATRSRYRFAVFGRADEACYRCGTPIRRVEANSRRLYLCDACQAPADGD